jgi:DNA-binding transcriptional LysR family regulator
VKLIALKALVAAVEDGSLRSAARRIQLSQPALTKMVRELEQELGAPLLTRTTQGVSPTPQGQILYERAKKVSKELGSAVDEISQLSGRMRGDLSIGAVPLAVMLLIPEALRTFSREFPEINLRISEELYFEQLERLRRGDVQVAVGGIPKGLASGEFVIEPLIETTMVVVVRKGSALQKVKSLKNLADAKWVYTGNTKDEGYAKTLYEMHGLPAPHVGALVNSTLALLSLVSAGEFVGLMPAQIAQSPIASQFISIVPVKEKALPLTVGAIVRSDMVVSPAVKHFINHLHRSAHQVLKMGL